MKLVALRTHLSEPAASKQDAKQHRVTRQLEILALRSFELADRVIAGDLPFIDAVELAYSAAVWADLPAAIEKSGLIDRNKSGAPTGDDIVQTVLAAVFENARGPQ